MAREALVNISKSCKKHFPRSHKLNKIFSVNIIKISYRSMTNVNDLIKQHDSKSLDKKQNATAT